MILSNLLAAFVTFATFISYSQCHMAHKPKLIIISFSGFRHDYIEIAQKKGKNVTNFLHFLKTGVTVETVVNVYPTGILPTYVSIATGLFPESHGYIDSEFHDPTLKANFNWLNKSHLVDSRWLTKGILPLWFMNQKQGRKSSTILWPAADTPSNKLFITNQFGISSLSEIPTLKYRIDRMLAWLQDDDLSTLGFLFFPQPGITAEKYGPVSSKVLDMIEQLDRDLGYLRRKIEGSEDFEELSIIFIGDRGMMDADANHIVTIKMDDIQGHVKTIIREPTRWHVWTDVDKTEKVYKSLKSSYPQLNVYKKSEIPPSWHFNRNPRIPPILITAHPGWRIADSIDEKEAMSKKRGSSGYEPETPEMAPLFLGWGHGFEPGANLSKLHMVDICSLACELIGIKHLIKTNGSLERVHGLLRKKNDPFINTTILTYLLVIGGCVLVAAILSLGAIFQSTGFYHRFNRRGGSGTSAQYRRHNNHDDPNHSASVQLLAQDGLDDIDL